MFTRYTAAFVLVLVVGYGLVKAWPLVSGPSIHLEPYTIDESGTLFLTGRAVHTETLRLNGSILLIDEQGGFRQPLTLPTGGVILSLTATDRFGRSVHETLPVFAPY